MGRYLIRRLGFAVLLIFVVSSAALLLTKVAPGDFAGAQGVDLTAAQREQIRENLGLNATEDAKANVWNEQLASVDAVDVIASAVICL